MDSQPSPFDALAEKYDSWYDGKGRLAFEVELEAPRPGFVPGASFVVLVASPITPE